MKRITILFFILITACGVIGSQSNLSGFSNNPGVLDAISFKHFIDTFQPNDKESIINAIPNNDAWDWMSENIPLFDCPDKEMEEIYYFRWWTYRKHIKKTPDGFIITEFLPTVSWATKYNAINCAAGHHFREGRWIHNQKYLDDYALFWFRVPGVEHHYSFWAANSMYERYLVTGDSQISTDLLGDLVKYYQKWGKERQLEDGLFWQADCLEGMEFSIGGIGCRPTINSYMYGDALAISKIARMAGREDLVKEYYNKSEQLKKLVEERLWDPQAQFFKTLRHKETEPRNEGSSYNANYPTPCKPGELADVRELCGYVPWYFNLPEKNKGYEVAWAQLTDTTGFLAPYGLTTAEQRHPKFRNEVIGCSWDGPVWPYATSQTLVAMANVINYYPQKVIGKKEYFEALKTYTRSQHITQEDGRVVPWIDESLIPSSGVWGTRKVLLKTEPDPVQKERGKDYNHSTYCDLIISGLVGLQPRADNIIEVNPLIPDGKWDYFCLDNVLYHSRIITILYDKTGKRYGKGKGFRIFADGHQIAGSKSLKRLEGKLP